MLQKLERSLGNVEISFRKSGDQTALDTLYQQGSGKARIVPAAENRPPEAIIINTSGGLTDGDQFEADISWGERSCAIATTQASERYYRARSGVAKLQTNLSVGASGKGFWLPQETIMFDGARIERTTCVSLTPSSRFLGIESIVFGRLAMNENVRSGLFKDKWQVYVDNELEFADCISLMDNIDDALARPSVAAGKRVLATIVCKPDKPSDVRDVAIASIDKSNGLGGATCLGPLVLVRIFASTAVEMRRSVIPLLNQLIKAVSPRQYSAAQLPRVWTL